jgi:hypothetical protein
MTPEHLRLAEARERRIPWKQWGTYQPHAGFWGFAGYCRSRERKPQDPAREWQSNIGCEFDAIDGYFYSDVLRS